MATITVSATGTDYTATAVVGAQTIECLKGKVKIFFGGGVPTTDTLGHTLVAGNAPFFYGGTEESFIKTMSDSTKVVITDG